MFKKFKNFLNSFKTMMKLTKTVNELYISYQIKLLAVLEGILLEIKIFCKKVVTNFNSYTHRNTPKTYTTILQKFFLVLLILISFLTNTFTKIITFLLTLCELITFLVTFCVS